MDKLWFIALNKAPNNPPETKQKEFMYYFYFEFSTMVRERDSRY